MVGTWAVMPPGRRREEEEEEGGRERGGYKCLILPQFLLWPKEEGKGGGCQKV